MSIPDTILQVKKKKKNNQIDDNLVKCGETHSNLCHPYLNTANFCGANVSSGNVQHWEVGKRDGHEEIEKQGKEKYELEDSWEEKCTRHYGRKRRGAKKPRLA